MSRRRLVRAAAAILIAPALPGCAAITTLGEASRPLAIYELRTPAVPPATGSQAGVEVVVEEPVASGAIATERILVRPSPVQAQYLPGIRWADPAPAMVQTLIVRTLLDTGALGSAGRGPIGAVADYAVLSELTDFQAEPFGEGAATIRLRLVARLVAEADARVVTSRTFAATEPAASLDPGDVVVAFDRAAARLLTDIARWVVAGAAGRA